MGLKFKGFRATLKTLKGVKFLPTFKPLNVKPLNGLGYLLHLHIAQFHWRSPTEYLYLYF